jgi:hypothetical protein
MIRYFFSLMNEQPFDDTDGLELPDLTAAHEEAVGFARDLMRLKPKRQDWSNWAVCVTDEDRKTVLNVPFTEAGCD